MLIGPEPTSPGQLTPRGVSLLQGRHRHFAPHVGQFLRSFAVPMELVKHSVDDRGEYQRHRDKKDEAGV